MPRPHFQIFKSLHFQIELIMMKLCLAFVLVGLCGILYAQVSNNSIKNRLHLEVDASPGYSGDADPGNGHTDPSIRFWLSEADSLTILLLFS